MNNKISYLLIILCSTITQISVAQTKKAYLKAAAESLEERDYYSALTYYSNVLEFDSTDVMVRHKVAESARNFNAYTTAVENYSYVLDADSISTYPTASYYLAEMWMMLGNYDDALDLYNIYLGEHSGENTILDSTARASIENISYAKEKLENPDESITLERLNSEVNTPYSEFAARDLGESLFYSSHSTEAQDAKWGKVVLGRVLESIDADIETINVDAIYDGKSVANAAFSQEDSVIVLTICEYISPDELRCDLYETKFASDTTFATPVKLPSIINVDSTTTTQPYIRTTEEGHEMYYVSDRYGGMGKLDIWHTTRPTGGTWTTPQNIKAINTPGNDISPAYSDSEAKLYWSSDSRRTLGGYDVYSIDKADNGDWQDITHLPAPINSSYNDIYYSSTASGDKAYLSSNRKGSLFIEPGQEACCYDIYSAEWDLIELDLNAMTFDILSRDSLTGVTVQLIDATTGRLLQTIHNDLGKDHFFDVIKGRDYLLVSSKEGFYNDTLELSTDGLDGPIDQLIYLDSDRYALDVATYDKRDGTPLLGTTVKLIDLNDNTIGDVVQINDEGHEYIFVMEPGKRYRIEGSKDGYVTSSEDVSTIGDIPDQRIKLDLYLDSYDLNEHLPVSLYFDNDQPDPGSRRTSTTKVYSDLYYDYLNQISDFQKRNPQEDEELVIFFDDKVKGGYVQMQLFYDELFKAMEQGFAINLTIKGHTSPLAVNKYNLVLGQRRVTSVKNDMATYRDGILRPYLLNGQIQITDISFGEETSSNDASDSVSNKRQSVYSVDASLERRVEIIKATKQ